MKPRLQSLALAVFFVTLPSLLLAQAPPPALSSHYPAGVEGVKAASLPPPGVYFRDYNYIYFADNYKNGPPGFDLLAYVQAPRLVWISDFKVLGAYYGADVLVPFAYQDLNSAIGSDSKFGLGDIFVEPITLSWHPKQFDVAVGYGFWAPSGDYDAPTPTDPIRVSPGKGFWTHMFTAGATWYPDAEKTWSLSALNRYEINQENNDLGITPGQVWTLEFGVGKSITKTIELGLAGYYQLQTTSDSGTGASNAKDYAFGVGPEINLFCSKLGLFTSIRYVREVAVHDRPEGNMVNVTFTKRF
jgi:hypothetical protein